MLLAAIARARSWMSDIVEGRVNSFDHPRLSGLPPDALAGSNSEREAPTTRVALILRELQQGVGPDDASRDDQCRYAYCRKAGPSKNRSSACSDPSLVCSA